jgi:DNA-binding response OmpR family regulator
VVAQVNALLRRISSDELHSIPVVFNEGLSIDFQDRVVKKRGETVDLTPTEYRLLVSCGRNTHLSPTAMSVKSGSSQF